MSAQDAHRLLSGEDSEAVVIRCSVPRSYDDDLPCRRPAGWQVLVACVHEHVSTDLVCEGCLVWLRGGRMVCVACAAADRSHTCPAVALRMLALSTDAAREPVREPLPVPAAVSG